MGIMIPNITWPIIVEHSFLAWIINDNGILMLIYAHEKKNEATLSLARRRPFDSRLDFSQHLLQLATKDSPKVEFFSIC